MWGALGDVIEIKKMGVGYVEINVSVCTRVRES